MRGHFVSLATASTRLPPLMKVLEKHGVAEQSALRLLRERGMTDRKAKARIRALTKAGVPIEGLTNKLGISNKAFADYIRRQSGPHRFTQTQENLFGLLLSKQVSEKIALKHATGKCVRLNVYEDKLKFFESFILDPKKFGMARIPVKSYQGFLGEDLNKLRKGILRNILNPLEDMHSARQLDVSFPQWRKLKVLNSKVLGKGTRPSAILARYRACLEKGVNPTSLVISNYSAETIRQKGLALKYTTPLGTQRGLGRPVVPTSQGISEADNCIRTIRLKMAAARIEKEPTREAKLLGIIPALEKYKKGQLPRALAEKAFTKAWDVNL